MDASPSVIEEQIDKWLEAVGAASIIRTDTVVTAVGEKPYACIVVAVWYEPPLN